jgi:hypothetical protein
MMVHLNPLPMEMMAWTFLFEFDGHGTINSDTCWYSMTTIITATTGAAAHDDDGNDMILVNSV